MRVTLHAQTRALYPDEEADGARATADARRG
jgi:hypothetical protein